MLRPLTSVFRVLISEANRVLDEVRWAKHGADLRWVHAPESQKRDVIPYHALIAGVQDLSPLSSERHDHI
jgi:hypothetical protein